MTTLFYGPSVLLKLRAVGDLLAALLCAAPKAAAAEAADVSGKVVKAKKKA